MNKIECSHCKFLFLKFTDILTLIIYGAAISFAAHDLPRFFITRSPTPVKEGVEMNTQKLPLPLWVIIDLS